MTKHIRIALVLGGVALPLLASLPALAQQPPGPPAAAQGDAARPRQSQLTQSDRAALLDARIAAVHAGLKLTPDQEKLWPALEKAVRDGMSKLADLRQQRRSAQRPANAIEAMSRRAEADLARGAAMKGIADAARPLYATLNDDQKRRLPLLMHAGRRDMGERGRERSDRGWRDHDGPMGRGREGMGPGRGDGMGPGRGEGMGPGPMRRGDRDEGPGGRRSDRDGFDRRN